MSLPSIKHQLLKLCSDYVDQRMTTARQSMEHAQQAANEEGKSSAGDKYETGRAMMHIERDKAAQQLSEAIKLKSVIDQIDPDIMHAKAMLGSLVITSSKKIFIAIGIGKLECNNETYLVIAPASPLGKALLGCTNRSRVLFNQEEIMVEKIL